MTYLHVHFKHQSLSGGTAYICTCKNGIKCPEIGHGRPGGDALWLAAEASASSKNTETGHMLEMRFLLLQVTVPSPVIPARPPAREVDSEYACLLYNTLFTARNSSKRNNTRSSAVAVIADRTACDVRYTSKLSNRFRLQLYELLVGYARYDSTGRVYDRTQTLIFSTVDHDH